MTGDAADDVPDRESHARVGRIERVDLLCRERGQARESGHEEEGGGERAPFHRNSLRGFLLPRRRRGTCSTAGFLSCCNHTRPPPQHGGERRGFYSAPVLPVPSPRASHAAPGPDLEDGRRDGRGDGNLRPPLGVESLPREGDGSLMRQDPGVHRAADRPHVHEAPGRPLRASRDADEADDLSFEFLGAHEIQRILERSRHRAVVLGRAENAPVRRTDRASQSFHFRRVGAVLPALVTERQGDERKVYQFGLGPFRRSAAQSHIEGPVREIPGAHRAGKRHDAQSLAGDVSVPGHCRRLPSRSRRRGRDLWGGYSGFVAGSCQTPPDRTQTRGMPCPPTRSRAHVRLLNPRKPRSVPGIVVGSRSSRYYSLLSRAVPERG